MEGSEQISNSYSRPVIAFTRRAACVRFLAERSSQTLPGACPPAPGFFIQFEAGAHSPAPCPRGKCNIPARSLRSIRKGEA